MAEVKQTIPTGKVLYTFVPTKNFDSEELKSSYVKGLTYSVREGNEILPPLVEKWRKAGLVN